ncbi:hypothetical protein Cpir12675_001711 [Ceratocystis pirilliformis]|uniref:RRM domain-containing protein n=1 Tax=Ceratocystis pirilliformis TaxID=259994 RepID=A0ABR3ZE93_9PEZI
MSLNTMDWDMEVEDEVETTTAINDQENTIDEESMSNTKHSFAIAPTKVHIRGVDVLTTSDVKAYVKEHFGEVDRVEWIDDTSANLLFSSAEIALDALNSLSVATIDHTIDPSPAQIYHAKPFTSKLENNLMVRCAFTTDKKESGAAARSRFYLLNPEHDPEERLQRRENHERDNQRNRKFQHNNYRERSRLQRDDDDEIEKFSNDFYDDLEDDRDLSRHHRQRTYSRSPNRSSRQNQSRELFPDRIGGSYKASSRDRSASPARMKEADITVDVSSNRPSRNKDRDQFIRDQQRLKNRGKDLFPDIIGRKTQASGSQMDLLDKIRRYPDEALVESKVTKGFAIKGAAKSKVKELFPSRFTRNSGKELFEEKLQGRGLSRQRAEDAW